MGQVVKCPDCKAEIELPDMLKPGKKYLCPDCDTRLPAPADPPRRKPTKPVQVEDDEEEGARPARKVKSRREEDDDDAPPSRRPKRRRDEDDEDRPRKKRQAAADVPFWKSRMGKILSGVGFIAVGIILIALALFTDSSKPLKGILIGVLAILVGLGTLGYGFMSSDDSSEDEEEDEDESDDSEDDE